MDSTARDKSSVLPISGMEGTVPYNIPVQSHAARNIPCIVTEHVHTKRVGVTKICASGIVVGRGQGSRYPPSPPPLLFLLIPVVKQSWSTTPRVPADAIPMPFSVEESEYEAG